MSRIAVIGSGISGLAAAWLLSRAHDIDLFERDARLGGHTHTHHLDTSDGPLALDTGFLVHNTRTYPRLIRLFDELGVACVDSDMSFGVSDRRDGFEYGTHGVRSLFADPRAFARPSHYRMLLEIVRFGRAARGLIAASAGTTDAGPTLGAFLDARRFGGAFVSRYLFPLAAAIWSASPATLRDFPALTLATFFDNHGMLDVLDHPTWRVVRGGSATYIPKLLASPRIAVHTGTPPTRVTRASGAGAVRLDFARRPSLTADAIVFACHGDEVLPLLADPTDAERDVFGAFETSPNEAWLHTDAALLPRRPSARAAWNYLLTSSSTSATLTYSLNRLQRLSSSVEYCVTLNPPEAINPAAVLARMTYRHPLYTRRAIVAQQRWADVSGIARTHYAGAYWFYGFHEDGLRSAVRVAEALGVTW